MPEGERFSLDSNTIISMIERDHALTPLQLALVGGIHSGQISAMFSEIALAECLLMPFRDRDARAVASIPDFLNGRPTLPLIANSRDIMIKAAQIRASIEAKLPDAIHIACAAADNCTVFSRADKRLRISRSMRRIAFHELVLP